MIRLSDKNKFLLGAAAVVALIVTVCLIFGATFDACSLRKIQKQETNIEQKAEQVEQSEKQVNETKEEAAEAKGEVKILKEVIKENNEEVNQKIDERRRAANRRERVRRNRVSNVNSADLKRILDDADRQP